MTSFEDSIKSKTISSGKNDPKATDLDYYMQPENYTGASLQSFQRFSQDKNKEDKDNKKVEKKKIVKDAQYHFYNRYKHILQDAIFLEDLLDREREEESEESDDGTDEAVPIVVEDGGKDSRKVLSDPLGGIKEEADDNEDQFHKGGRLLDVDRKSLLSARSGDFDMHPDDWPMTPDSTGARTPGGSKKRPVLSSMGDGSSGRASVAIQRVQMDKLQKEMRMRELKETFVKAVKFVKAVCRISASARGKFSPDWHFGVWKVRWRASAAETLREIAITFHKLELIPRQTGGDMSSMRTFMDIADDETNTEENMKNAGLSFDPTFFKAKKEISLSAETKNILTTPSEQRTPDQVQTAMFGLQTLRSYAEYPLHMQEKLAKVAWYEVVAPKRIIIRQGHFAENFYFILSGNAVVTILLKDPKTGSSFVKIATVMKKGMSFGELALLHHSKRTATVTSQDTVQLLSIGREDFFDIFMASSDGPDAMPDHIKFISNLDFMKDWPIDQLVDNPQHCLLHFFKRNTTIVANSNCSEWMYIVKTGSCQVLKKLKGVIPNCKFYSKPKIDDDEFSTARMKAIIFAPKVDTGLRKRKNSSENEEQDDDETSEDEDGDKVPQKVTFSKDQYSKSPATRAAHFSAESSFDRRKHYDPPKRCKPKKVKVITEQAPPVKPGPVFVQVSTLKPRDVFGLDTVQFDEDITRMHTSVSLVSRGAECIMMSKEFYVKHATEKVKMHIREYVRPYPDEHVFQGNLQIKEDWTLYREVMLTDITSRLVETSNRFNS